MPALIESELVGYVKGAFTTGANRSKDGPLVSAEDCAVFLDELP